MFFCGKIKRVEQKHRKICQKFKNDFKFDKDCYSIPIPTASGENRYDYFKNCKYFAQKQIFLTFLFFLVE